MYNVTLAALAKASDTKQGTATTNTANPPKGEPTTSNNAKLPKETQATKASPSKSVKGTPAVNPGPSKPVKTQPSATTNPKSPATKDLPDSKSTTTKGKKKGTGKSNIVLPKYKTIQDLLKNDEFFFKIKSKPRSLEDEVYKSYDVENSTGTGIFTIENGHSRHLSLPVTTYEVAGMKESETLKFIKEDKLWGDQEFLRCCPKRSASDGITAYLGEKEIGVITVRNRACKKCVFQGWRINPCCNYFPTKYYLAFIGEMGTPNRFLTKGIEDNGLEIFDSFGEIIGTITLIPEGNRFVNTSEIVPDFILSISKSNLHEYAKATLIALALRHQLNVLLIHKLPPVLFKYYDLRERNYAKPSKEEANVSERSSLKQVQTKKHI